MAGKFNSPFVISSSTCFSEYLDDSGFSEDQDYGCFNQWCQAWTVFPFGADDCLLYYGFNLLQGLCDQTGKIAQRTYQFESNQAIKGWKVITDFKVWIS